MLEQDNQARIAETTEYRIHPDWPAYKIGSDGTVFSCWKHTKGRKCILSDEWRQLKGRPDKNGYLKFTLCYNRKTRCVAVHILVLEAFIGPAPHGLIGAHNNGNNQDNSLSNLRWDTYKNNSADTFKHGTNPAGERNPSHKFTNEQVKEIRKRYADGGESLLSLGNEFKVWKSTIGDIVNKVTWREI